MSVNSQMSSFVEFVKESTFGTMPENPTMGWLGDIESFSPKDKVISETKLRMRDAAATERIQGFRNVKVGEELGFDLKYQVQPGDVLNLIEAATGINGTTKTSGQDIIDTYSFGVGYPDFSSPQYEVYKGCICESLKFIAPEDGILSCETSWLAADKTDKGTTDYIGTGSHASETTDDPLTVDNISSFQLSTDGIVYNDISDCLNDFTLSIENKVGLAKHLTDTKPTRIKDFAPISRAITLEMGLDYDEFSLASTVRSYAELYVKFIILDGSDTHTFIVSGVRFPELPYELGKDDLIGDTVKSDNCWGLSVTTT